MTTLKIAAVCAFAFAMVSLAVADDGLPSSQYIEAVQVMKQGNHESAAVLFHKVLSGEGKDEEIFKERAEYFLAQCLAKVGLTLQAKKILNDISMRSNHVLWGEVTKDLLDLHWRDSTFLNSWGRLGDSLNAWDLEELEKNLKKPSLSSTTDQDRAHYSLGFFFRDSLDQHGTAIRFLSRISDGSGLKARALFVMGTEQVVNDEPLNALKSFKALTTSYLSDFAWLNIARVRYKLAVEGKAPIDEAIHAWNQVKTLRVQALQELASAYYHFDNHAALDAIAVAFSVPEVSGKYDLDFHFIHALSLYKRQQSEAAQTELSELIRAYTPVFKELKAKYDETYADHGQSFGPFYDQIVAGKSSLSPLAAQLVRSYFERDGRGTILAQSVVVSGLVEKNRALLPTLKAISAVDDLRDDIGDHLSLSHETSWRGYGSLQRDYLGDLVRSLDETLQTAEHLRDPNDTGWYTPKTSFETEIRMTSDIAVDVQ